MRAVIDTKVLAGALIRRQGVSGQVLLHLRDGDFTFVYSVPLILEQVEALSRPHIQHRYHIRSDDNAALIKLIRLRGSLVSPNRKIDTCRDPKNNCSLQAADERDADLLDMREFEGIPILFVAEFLAQL